MPAKLSDAIAQAVEAALREDLGPDQATGDITTEAIISDKKGSAVITANQDGIVAGLPVAAAVFAALGPAMDFMSEVKDGDEVDKGRILVRLSGDLKTILKGERAALNFLSHLSGIATLTRKYVEAVAGTTAKIYDTRKTTPCLRVLEKYAVAIGGGCNHRFGLFDGILVKDNHLVGRTIREAVALVRKVALGRPIEVEVETLEQLHEAIDAGANTVLLDNMSLDLVKEAVALAKGKVEIEISGGLSLNNVGGVAAAGAERISVGAITQSAPPLDFSLTVL